MTRASSTTIVTIIFCFSALILSCDGDAGDTDPGAGASSGTSSGGPACGDGVVDSGEECDPAAADIGADCVSQGFEGGVLGCRADCTFDTSACYLCGDQVKSGPEQCDGADLGGATCESAGLGTGSLGCTAACLLDTSACCTPQCAGQSCGDDGCGGTCGPCDPPSACCTGVCVPPPSSCSCVCNCTDTSNPNCQNVQATSSAASADCLEVCQNGCMGCGPVVSASGDCPPTATCD